MGISGFTTMKGVNYEKNIHEGAKLEDFLKEEFKDPEIKKEAEAIRLGLEIGQMIKRIIKQQKLSFRTLAQKMGGSLLQVQRLINNDNVNLNSLSKFAIATGKTLRVHIQ